MANKPPVFALRFGGQPYEGWTEIAVTRDLTRMSGEFALRLVRQDGDAVPAVTPGRAAQIEIDGRPVLTGWIDTMVDAYDKDQSEISVTGRDKVADLIDCAASVDGPFEFLGLTLVEAVRRVAKPYGIKVTHDLPAMPPIKRLAIQPGESAFDFIERACRSQAVLPVSDGIGGLLLTRPGTSRSPGMLVYGENVLAASMTVDATDRHSLYVVKGQAEALDSDTDAAQMAGAEGRATDEEVTRYRPKLLVGENQGYDMTLRQRAEWEKKIARSRGTQATYTVQGWYASGTTLWQPNTLVWVRDSKSGLNRELLITSVSFRRSTNGTTTLLGLALPDSFDIPAEKEDAKSSSTTTLWVDDNG